MTYFTVELEDSNGKLVGKFYNVAAQTKKEAINKVKSGLVFSAEREPGCASK
jgi:hypothetical protein